MGLSVNDFGSTFRVKFSEPTEGHGFRSFDLTGSTIVFRFVKPSNEVVDKDANMDPTETDEATYVVESDLLDEAGTWQWQAVVTRGLEGEWSGRVREFVVDLRL